MEKYSTDVEPAPQRENRQVDPHGRTTHSWGESGKYTWK